MKKILCSLLIFSVIILIVTSMMCSNLPVHSADGGGTETIIGSIVFDGGGAASGVSVTLIPDAYNPVSDNPLSDALTTITDQQGDYILCAPSPGVYNILAKHPDVALQLFRFAVTVDENDTVYISPDTLKGSGVIKVVLPDTVDTANGYLFIKGTNIFRRLSSGNHEEGGLYSLLIDQIPPAEFSNLFYAERVSVDPIQINERFTVYSNDTTLIEAFDYTMVLGMMVYPNGVPAAGTQVYIIPTNYNPLKDPQRLLTMVDTVDLQGEFRFKITTEGLYAMQAIHSGNNLHSYQPDISVQGDTLVLLPDTLEEPGIIKMIMPDTMDTVNGYMYIEGTLVYKPLTQSTRLNTGFAVLFFDAVPPMFFSSILYARQNNNTPPTAITDTFSVLPNDTTHLEAFIRWYHYTTANAGLPSNDVLDMVMTPNGTKWFGTDAGAVSFDGNGWQVYNRGNSGLLSDTIMSVDENTDGALWFGTSYGVTKYNGVSWETFTTGNSPLPDDSIFEVVADGAGSIWIGTDNGAARFNDVDVWDVYTTQNSPLPHPEVYCVGVDNDGVVWLGTDGGGLVRYDGVNWTIYDENNSSLPSKAIFAIHIDSSNTKWIGTMGGVARYNGVSWDFITTGGHTNYDYTVSAIAIDKNNTKWFGTYEGGRVFRFDDVRTICYNTATSIISSHAFEMFAIGIDAQNNKWVATSRDGIYVFGPVTK